MAGIETMEDILEEIVGEIQDEFDAEEDKITPTEDGAYEVTGAISIDEFREHFKLPTTAITEEVEADTLAGLLTQVLGEMPKIGQTVTIANLILEISEVGNNRIQRVQVRQQPVTTVLSDKSLH